MVTEKIVLNIVNIDATLNEISKSKISVEDKKDIPRFVQELRLGKVTGRPSKDGTLGGYLGHLQIILEFINKPTSKLTEKDIDYFWDSLLRGKLKQKPQSDKPTQPYADSHKLKLRNTFLMYLKWKLGEANAHKISKSLRTKFRVGKKIVDFMPELDVEKLFKACKSTKQRFIVAVLFDSGARRQEFYNIRKSDIELPSGNNPYVTLTLREEFSKTLGRTISLYWKYTSKAVQDYMLERIEQGIQPEDAVFDLKENPVKSVQSFLSRLGKKVLNKRVHFHLFRKSSATYYSRKLNGARDKLCRRYGWRYSSPMVDVYISRANVMDIELDEKMKNSDLEELRTELEQYKTRSSLKDNEIKEIKEQLKNVVIGNAKEMKQVKELLKLLKSKH